MDRIKEKVGTAYDLGYVDGYRKGLEDGAAKKKRELIDKGALLEVIANHMIEDTLRREYTFNESAIFEFTKGDLYKHVLEAPVVKTEVIDNG